MVFMPPQHGKSELVSRRLPAYILGRNPKTKIIVSSYSAVLASSFNRDCQRIIDNQTYNDVFPNTILNQSNVVTVSDSWLRNSEIFEVVTHGGFLKAVGVGGSLTGTPVDVGIIDDPVKDSLEASSPTYKQRNWEWYNDVFSTRLHNKSKQLLTMTRWDVNDLAGMILKHSAKDWTVLHLPAIKENNLTQEDPRKIGEALWENKHSLARLLKVKETSMRTFVALYQQDPKPVETGGEFYKHFKIAKHTGDCSYDPTLPLHLSFDENVNPYFPCGIFQIKGKKIMLIKEIAARNPNNTVSWVCREIERLYPAHKSGMFIYGDATSQKADVKQEKGHDLFKLIIDLLDHYKPTRRVSKANPSVVMRGMFINTIFETNYGEIEFIVDTKCEEAITDFVMVKEAADGTKDKSTDVDMQTGVRHQRYGHFSDLTDYLICYAFSIDYLNYQRGDRPVQYQGGSNEAAESW